MNFLERQPDSLSSIGNDSPTLLAFKAFTALPTDSNWTESDVLLSALLNSAERLVDELTGCPYRLRSFTYTFNNFTTLKKSYATVDFIALKIPVWPVAATPLPTITWIADDATTGTWTAGTDFNTFGLNTLTPEIIFPYTFVLPSTATVPYPYVLSFAAGGGSDGDVKKLCIFELAATYYRSPEMISDRQPFISAAFQANLDHLKGSFLG